MPHARIEAVIFDVAGTLLPCDTSTADTPLPAATLVFQQLKAEQQRIGLLSQTATQLPPALHSYPHRAANDAHRPAPAPDLPTLVALALESQRLSNCVLVSGSCAGVEAGLSAGMWTVGTALTGSLDQQAMSQWQQLPSAEQDQLRMQATMALLNAGAHYVIDAVDELLPCLADIKQRLQKGERA